MPITEEQRAARVRTLGSSDIPRLMMGGATDLWLERTLRCPMVDLTGNAAAEAGTILQDAVLDWHEAGDTTHEESGVIRRDVELMVEELRLCLHTDAVHYEGNIPAEAKTSGLFGPLPGKWGDDGTDQVPDNVIWQCQAHMLGWDAEYCWVPALLGGRGFQRFRVGRSEKGIKFIQEAVKAFWVAVDSDTPPERRPTLEVAARIRRKPNKVISIPAHAVLGHIERFEKAKREVKVAQGKRDEAKAKILMAMEDAEEAHVEGDGERFKTLTHYEQSQRRIDAKALRAGEPDIAARYTNTSTFRKLYIKEPKKGD